MNNALCLVVVCPSVSVPCSVGADSLQALVGTLDACLHTGSLIFCEASCWSCRSSSNLAPYSLTQPSTHRTIALITGPLPAGRSYLPTNTHSLTRTHRHTHKDHMHTPHTSNHTLAHIITHHAFILTHTCISSCSDMETLFINIHSIRNISINYQCVICSITEKSETWPWNYFSHSKAQRFYS